jgi:glycosyltransferase involved in cell wall biosynthesis
MSERILLSIVTPCFNEEGNIDELYTRIKAATVGLKKYEFELIFIDNHSEDSSVAKLKRLAAIDPMVKIIVNTRNFGHIRSPYYGILQSRGAATIYLASDLQDPPELIPQFVSHWEEGYKLVMATKPASKKVMWLHAFRKIYYDIIDGISDITITRDATGFGLYDKEVLDHLRKIDDPYPFLRGLVCELGFEIKKIEFDQPRRLRGISNTNFLSLYDIAMLGIISHSKIPLRLTVLCGFLLGGISLVIAIVYTVLKLLFWDSFPLGIAPAVIGLFFLFGMQMLFVGILGEYIGAIYTHVQKRPTVVEKERINF